MKKQQFNKVFAALFAVVILLTATAALAQTVEPIQELMPESLAGQIVRETGSRSRGREGKGGLSVNQRPD